MQGDCVPSQFSKVYLMYSATDAASAALDFSKRNVEDGVVDSPPSRSADRTPICSPSPLRDCRSTSIRQRSHSPVHHNVRTPQRQLYCKASLDMDEAKEKDHVHCSINIPVERGLVSPTSQSQAAVRPRRLDKEGRLLRTQSLSNQRSPGIRRENCYLWARLPTLLGINPILSLLYVRLFGNVGSVSGHPLGLLAQRPILVGTRS
jgi:hypothetical protein